MKHTIEFYTPCADDKALIAELSASPILSDVHILEAEMPFIALERNTPTHTLKRIANQCEAEYLLLYTHIGHLKLSYRAIERMLRTAIESRATSTQYMSGTILGPGDTATNKTESLLL